MTQGTLDGLDAAARRALLEELLRKKGATAPPPAGPRRVARDRAWPLSSSAEQVWFLHHLGVAVDSFHLGAMLHLRGALEPAHLEAALTQLVSRHEAFRTSFIVEGGRPLQRILPPSPVRLPVESLERGAAAGSLLEQARDLAGEEIRRPFDLAIEGPLRLRLLRLAPDAHVLIWVVHTIACDGLSLSQVLEEFRSVLTAVRAGEAPPGHAPELQPVDFAVWEREHLASGAGAAQLAAWTEAVASWPALLELPRDAQPAPQPTYRCDQVELAVPPEVLRGLDRRCRDAGVTRFQALLLAFQRLCRRWTGAERLLVGVPTSGRIHPTMQAAVGRFTNTLAIRGDLREDGDDRSSLLRTRRETIEAFARQDTPFASVVAARRPERREGQMPLVQVIFGLQTAVDEAWSVPGLEVDLAPLNGQTSPFDLTCQFFEDPRAGTLQGMFLYREELFSRSTIERAGPRRTGR